MKTLLAMTIALAMIGSPLQAKSKHSAHRHAKAASAKKSHPRAGRHPKSRQPAKEKEKAEPATPEMTPAR